MYATPPLSTSEAAFGFSKARTLAAKHLPARKKSNRSERRIQLPSADAAHVLLLTIEVNGALEIRAPFYGGVLVYTDALFILGSEYGISVAD